MNSKLLFFSIFATIFIILIILNILKKGRINIKYAILWLLAFSGLLIVLLIPNLLNTVTDFFGFSLSSNMILVFFIAILVLVCSGVLAINIRVNVGSFSEAKDKIIEWYDEVVVPIFERGVNIE